VGLTVLINSDILITVPLTVVK